MRVAVDAMGGDHAPEPIVEGSIRALEADPELSVVLVGDQDRVEPLVSDSPQLAERIRFEHTTDFVEMHESPAMALRGKPKSSINLCWRLLAEGAVQGLVSAGNTGAAVAGGYRTRRFLRGIQRPGIAVTVPSPQGHSVVLDVGANVHAKAEHLLQYAVMGSIFAKQLFGVERPTVGLMNVGSEDSKGNGLAKEASQMIAASPLRDQYLGNVEGRDVCRGIADVIVCDGFVGNIVLKTCEGMVEFLLDAFNKEVVAGLDTERDRAVDGLRRVAKRYHHSEFGGAPLLGIDGVCLICHGASDARSICNAIHHAKKYGVINRLIVQEMEVAFAEAGLTANAS